MLVEHARRTPHQSPAHFIPTSSGADLPGYGPMSGGHCRALVASTGPEVPAVAAGLPW